MKNVSRPSSFCPFAHYGIDFERGVARQRTLEKRMLEARRPLDEQHPAAAALRRHQHAAGVVLATISLLSAGVSTV